MCERHIGVFALLQLYSTSRFKQAICIESIGDLHKSKKSLMPAKALKHGKVKAYSTGKGFLELFALQKAKNRSYKFNFFSKYINSISIVSSL
jgi:hypothetical protein